VLLLGLGQFQICGRWSRLIDMDHDHSYKLLFSHSAMVADLLRGFVREEWVQKLDFSSLERVGDAFVTDDLREREDDLVWRVRLEKEWLYVYLLIEFQSTIDRFMAVRIQVYPIWDCYIRISSGWVM
jgi:predicted transposase YdaD